MKLLLSFSYFIFFLNCYSQTGFEKTFGDSTDNFLSTSTLVHDGGVIFSFNGDSSLQHLIRIDQFGDTVWFKDSRDLGIGNNPILDIIQTKDSNFVFLHNQKISKINQLGDTLWNRRIGGYDYTEIAESPNGNLYVIGYRMIINNGVCCTSSVKKLLPNGLIDSTFRTSANCNSSNGCKNVGIKIASDGNIILAVAQAGGPPILRLFKLDTNGTTLWNRWYSFNVSLGAVDIIELINGNFLISSGFSGIDPRVIKVSNTGAIILNKVFAVNSSNNISSSTEICKIKNGYLLATQSNDIELRFLDTNLNLVHFDSIGGNQNERLGDLIRISDSVVVITGSTYSYGVGGSDAYIKRIDSIGLITSESETNNNISDINIFPNPTLEKLFISKNNILEIKSLQIFSIDGSFLADLSLEQISNGIDLSFLSSGIYFLKVRTRENISIHKFIKH